MPNAITYYGIISVIKKHYSTDDLEMKPPLITNMMQRKDISKYIYKYFNTIFNSLVYLSKHRLHVV
jgi:hypothetical protein